MEPPGGGVAEVRLYRRRSHGAELLASLELVAPPRLLEVEPDPPVAEDVDGDLGRSAGFYLALVQDGRVVDVARLLHYSGEPAGPEDYDEDYWETGSNTSNEEISASPPPPREVFQYRSTSSSSNSSEDDSGKSTTDERRLTSSSSSNNNTSEDDPGKSTAEDRGSTSSSDGYAGKSSTEDSGLSSSSSSQGYAGKNSLEDDRIDVDIWDRGSDKKDDDGEDDDDIEEDEDGDDEEESEDDGGEEDGSDRERAEDGDDEEDDEDDGGEENDSDREEVEDGDNDEEEDDGDEEEDDGDGEEENDAWKLSLRLWPAKKHLRLNIFSGEKWIAIKVYRLTWINEEELEELFKSSFKMDIGAPISASTVFRIQDCTMDFELSMIHTPKFDELVSELKASVRDFKFCQKIGGEGDCRVFKCLLEGGKFALKTVRLEEEEPCTMQPREILIISSLKDKRVMKFYKAWVEPWVYKKRPIAHYLFIQLELCPSTLKDLLLPENFNTNLDRWNLSEEIAKAVKTIHDESIVHRDLKPDNVFFGADMGVRIGDFGDSCIGRDELGGYGGTPKLGTPYYSAPELAFAQKITEKVDTYSVGVMFLEIFTRFRTFFERRGVFEGLINGAIPDSCCALAGDREGAHGLVKRMTAVEPAYRLSDTEILEYIQQITSEELGDGVDGPQAGDEAVPNIQQITSQELGDGVDGSQAEG